MSDEPEAPEKERSRTAKAEASGDDPWRTMAGLLGRAWLARDRPDLSGGFARARGTEPGLVPRPTISVDRPLLVPAPPVGDVSSRPAGGGRSPLGGVASFVADVAAARPPMDPDAARMRTRSAEARHHRGIHCHLGGPHGTASHNPCQRLPPLG